MYPYILWSAAYRENVLPLTSTCNLRCVFCSNIQNPRGVQIYAVSHLPLSLVKGLIPCLDSRRKIIIGEAATRINEGEPFTHPLIWQVLEAVRECHPATPLQITTNGTLLNRAAVNRLADLEPLSVNLSLNSATPEGRYLLMGDREPDRALEAARLLGEAGIEYHGSLVAMPHLVGWPDLEDTCRFLQDQGVATIRIFLPGFTKLAPSWLRFHPEEAYRQLRLWVRQQQERLRTPLLLEPPPIEAGESLKAEIAGVIAGSPAAWAGLQAGDTITAVCGRPVRCRTEAFRLAERFAHPVLDVVRPGLLTASNSCSIFKKRSGRSGLVMHYDLDWNLVESATRVIRRHQARRVLILTSVWGFPWLHMVLPEWRRRACGEVHLAAVPNHFFGGSIAAAGLLTTLDFASAIRAIRRQSERDYDLLLLPGIAFDNRGRDLLGRSYTHLQAITKGNIVPV